MKLGAALLGGLLALAPLAAGAEPPPASEVDSARAHYKLGARLYDEGRYEAALVELERAYALAPTYKLLYDLGLVQLRLGDFARALSSFEGYRDGVAGRADVPAARRAEVGRMIDELSRKVALVTVTATPPDAAITVDERAVAGAPTGKPLRVNPGPHRVTASKEGFAESTREIDLAPGQSLDVTLVLEPKAAEPPASAPPAPAPAAPVTSPPPIEAAPAAAPQPPPLAPAEVGAPPPLWIGWTVAGTLAAGAATTGVAALVKSHELEGQVNDRATAPDVIHSTHATTVTLALVSDVLTGAALAAAGVTLYVTHRSGQRPPPTAPRAEVRAGPSGLVIRGMF